MAWTLLNEIKRKSIHIIVLILIWLFYVLKTSVSKEIALLALLCVLLFLLAIEYLRLELNLNVPVLNQIIRAKEERRMHGAIYFIASTIICLAVFDFRIALAALFMTVFGDMFAALVGKVFGKTLLFKNKTLVGSVTELVICIIVGLLILENIYIIIAMAFAATLVETFVSDLEDNLFVPLFAGFVGQLLFLLI